MGQSCCAFTYITPRSKYAETLSMTDLAEPCASACSLHWHQLVTKMSHAFARFLDGRVWPLEDELEVRLMIDLIRHVTGRM